MLMDAELKIDRKPDLRHEGSTTFCLTLLDHSGELACGKATCKEAHQVSLRMDELSTQAEEVHMTTAGAIDDGARRRLPMVKVLSQAAQERTVEFRPRNTSIASFPYPQSLFINPANSMALAAVGHYHYSAAMDRSSRRHDHMHCNSLRTSAVMYFLPAKIHRRQSQSHVDREQVLSVARELNAPSSVPLGLELLELSREQTRIVRISACIF